MGHHLVQEALIWVATGQYGAIAAAEHGGVIGRQVEIRAHLFLIVAIQALVAEDGQNIILKGTLVRGVQGRGGKQHGGNGNGLNVPFHRLNSP